MGQVSVLLLLQNKEVSYAQGLMHAEIQEVDEGFYGNLQLDHFDLLELQEPSYLSLHHSQHQGGKKQEIVL